MDEWYDDMTDFRILANQYAAPLAAAAQRYPTVPPALIAAIVTVESGWDANAYRSEAQIADASIGLMQMLVGTARSLGYSGSGGTKGVSPAAGQYGTGLYDPATSLLLGTHYLSNLIAAKGSLESAVSAYNNGSGKKATVPTRVIAARDAAGNPTSYRDVPVGDFYNQPYVDRVLSYYQQFGGVGLLPPIVTTGRSSPMVLAAIVLVGGVILLARAARGS